MRMRSLIRRDQESGRIYVRVANTNIIARRTRIYMVTFRSCVDADELYSRHM